MLCYRCGSYNPDGKRSCEVCGQSFAERRRTDQANAWRNKLPHNKPPFAAGTLIAERYRLYGAAIAGTCGWVFHARDEEVEIDVGLKITSPLTLLKTDAEHSAFSKTVRRARSVQHPNITRIYAEGQHDKYSYYTMAFLEGLTLRKSSIYAVKRSGFLDWRNGADCQPAQHRH
ncbi:MAG: hypothetical protein R3C68_05600 [Myxococcota bacterium]